MAFPPTRWSAVVAARSAEEVERRRGLERIAETYWRPVYRLVRARWGRSHEDARELTQEFFSQLVERDLLRRFDPEKGRLRTYLRTCLEGLVLNDDRDAARRKRGGDAVVLSLDDAALAEEPVSASLSTPQQADAFFEAEWVRSLFTLALARFKAECAERGKTGVFALFERYDLSDDEPRPTYARLAEELGLKVTDVTNHLAYARREMRRITLEALREMTATEDEFRSEARALLGIEPGAPR